MNRPTNIITHHAVSAPHHTVEDVDDWHKKRWPGFTSKRFKNKRGKYFHVGYHFVIEKDGTVTQTRAITEKGLHCIGKNTSSIGVCFMGNFDIEMPTLEQNNAFKELFASIQERYPYLQARDIKPHRAYANKSCHGKLLTANYFATVIDSDEALKRRRLEQLKSILTKLVALLTEQRMREGVNK